MRAQLVKSGGVVGSGEKDQYLDSFRLHVNKKTLSLNDHVMSILAESTGKTSVGDFGPPLTVQSHHVRRFFNKMQLGIHSVQNYLGKVLNTREELVDYFINTIGTKAYGTDWLYKELIKQFNEEDQGLFLVTDLTLEEAKKLKTMLGSSFALVLVAESSEEKVDFLVKPQTTKAATKRVTLSVVDKLTQTENRRNKNDRPTTESQLQS
jgi:hypothetical protein